MYSPGPNSKLTILLICLLAFGLTTVRAQPGIGTFSKDTIRYYKNREGYFLPSGKKRPTISQLKLLLSSDISSAAEYRKYQRLATPGTIILLTGITAGVIALTNKKDTHFFTPYTITLFSSDIIGIPMMIRAKKHLRRSVKLNNLSVE